MTDLAHLLATWERTRDPRIADAIDAATPAPPAPCVGAGTTQEHEDAWLARASAGRPEDLAELLATMVFVERDDLARTPLDSRRVIVRLRALTGRADPRIAAALVKLLADPPSAPPGAG